MKMNVTGAILWGACVLVAATASAQDPDPLREATDTAEPVPLEMGAVEQRLPQQLREVLRHFMERTEESLKPHRLSPEERQRMREQLRNPVSPVNPVNPGNAK